MPDLRTIPQTDEAKLVHLAQRWPLGESQQTSGINCATVLLRIVFSALLQTLWDGKDARAVKLEESSPLIGHAWLAFDTLQDHDAIDALVEKMWGKPLGEVAAADHMALSFERLANEALQALWALDEFQLFAQVLWRRLGDGGWTAIGHPTTPRAVTAKFLRGPLCPRDVRLRAFPGMDLSAEVNKLFGGFSAGDLTVLQRPAASPFFYATLDVQGVGKEKLSFDAIRSFELTLGTFDDTPEHAGVWHWTDTTLSYNLMAIVKQRKNAPGGSDFIRLYNRLGPMIRPAGPPTQMTGYVDDRWRLAALGNGDTFFALWVRAAGPPRMNPPFPEVAKPVCPNDAHENDMQTARGLIERHRQAGQN